MTSGKIYVARLRQTLKVHSGPDIPSLSPDVAGPWLFSPAGSLSGELSPIPPNHNPSSTCFKIAIAADHPIAAIPSPQWVALVTESIPDHHLNSLWLLHSTKCTARVVLFPCAIGSFCLHVIPFQPTMAAPMALLLNGIVPEAFYWLGSWWVQAKHGLKVVVFKKKKGKKNKKNFILYSPSWHSYMTL